MATLIEVLAAHQEAEYSWGVDGCVCGWDGLGEDHPAHVAEAIAAAGLAVIEVPDEMVDRTSVAKVLRGFSMWQSGDSRDGDGWACLHRDPTTYIEFEADGQRAYGELSVTAARNLAAALLGAANAAAAVR